MGGVGEPGLIFNARSAANARQANAQAHVDCAW